MAESKPEAAASPTPQRTVMSFGNFDVTVISWTREEEGDPALMITIRPHDKDEDGLAAIFAAIAASDGDPNQLQALAQGHSHADLLQHIATHVLAKGQLLEQPRWYCRILDLAVLPHPPAR